jgi:hypothetical protein
VDIAYKATPGIGITYRTFRLDNSRNQVQYSPKHLLGKVGFVDFFGAIIQKINAVGYSPLAPLQKSKTNYTLHNVVRDQLGMTERVQVAILDSTGKPRVSNPTHEEHITADLADVAFWDYRELRAFLETVYQLMDNEVTRMLGKQTNAVAWSHEPDRTQLEILGLMKNLQAQNGSLAVPPTAAKRPVAKNMIQRRLVWSAIANTCAVLVGNGSNYSELFQDCAMSGLNDESLLDMLDSRILKNKFDRKLIDSESLIPRSLVAARSKKESEISRVEPNRLTMSQFLKTLNESKSISSESASDLLSRLTSGQADKS